MIALLKRLNLYQSRSLRFWLSLGLMVSLWSFTAVQSHADGYFSANNLAGPGVFDGSGQLVSKPIGRVEVVDGVDVLARGVFLKDGYFALGTVYVPGPGTSREITVRIWDASIGETYADAFRYALGPGTIADKVIVSLSKEPTPTKNLNSFGYRSSTLLSFSPDVPWRYSPTFRSESIDSHLDFTSGRPNQLRFQLLRSAANAPSFPLQDQSSPPNSPGISTGGLYWSSVGNHWEAAAILRLWDASTGDSYDLATLRAASTVTLYGDSLYAEMPTLDPPSIRFVRTTEAPIGKFQVPGGVVRVLGIDGTPVQKSRWQVELMAGKTLIRTFPLPDDGTFPLPPTSVPGTLPLDLADVSVRIWDRANSETFEEASVIGLLTDRLALGGDNIPAASLSTNVVRMNYHPASPPEIVPPVRRKLYIEAKAHQTMKVTAFGVALHYQWQFAGPEGIWSDLADGAFITGTQTATLELSQVSPDQAGVYRAIVSNPFGTATNSPVELYVHDIASIRFAPTPTFQYGSRTVVHAFADGQLPTSTSLVSGPASASVLLDGSTQIEPTGTGPIILRVAKAGTSPYAQIYADFTFQIDKASQSIDFANLPSVLAPNASLRIVATADSGLRVSVNVVSGPGRLDSSNVLQVLGPGLITLTATQPGDANYLPASITRSIEVVEVPPAARIVESGPGFALIFRGESGRIHVVESTESLTGAWQEVVRKPGSGPTLDTIVTLPPASDSVRFYRLRFE